MDAFNSMPALSSGGNPGDPLVLSVNAGGQPLGLDGFDPDMPFDESLLDNVNSGLSMPFTPSYDFDSFANFEDPFSTYSSGPRPPYDAAAHHLTSTGATIGVHTHHHHHHHPSVAAEPFDLTGTGAGSSHADVHHHGGPGPGSGSPDDGLDDDKLLGFSAPQASGKAHLVDDATGQLLAPGGPGPGGIGMAAELFGMFFVAEDVYNAEPPNAGRPTELTCYRRNLWQCSGRLTLPRHVSQLVDAETGRRVPVAELAASITAVESIEGKATEIISIPWKSAAAAAAQHQQQQQQQQQVANGAAAVPASAAPQATTAATTEEAAKVAGAPPRVTLDLAGAAEAEEEEGGGGGAGDGQRVTVPVSWKRLQFKHATANNGRRKGLQQHYVVQINLLARCVASAGGGGGGDDSPATTSAAAGAAVGGGGGAGAAGSNSNNNNGGEFIKIAEIQSGPVIVRGRSPRNFDSRKDVPLTGSGGMGSVGGGGGGGGLVGGAGGERKQGRSMSGGAEGVKTESMQKFHAMANMQQTPIDWTTTQPFGTPQQQLPPHPAKKLALASPSLARPPVPAWSSSESILSNSNNNNNTTPGPPQQQKHPVTPSKPPPGLHRATPTAAGPTQLPISLSLSEDERSPSRAGAGVGVGASEGLASPRFAAAGGGGPSLGSGGGGVEGAAAAAPRASPIEDGELLYEYFPLSLDDWMPPVDAIYRPHVVHHTVVPPEVRAQQSRSRTKRYFAPD